MREPVNDTMVTYTHVEYIDDLLLPPDEARQLLDYFVQDELREEIHAFDDGHILTDRFYQFSHRLSIGLIEQDEGLTFLREYLAELGKNWEDLLYHDDVMVLMTGIFGYLILVRYDLEGTFYNE